MATTPLTISFVSGKGGVGKTSLAANFAWICSRFARTILVDLDFQNQGCTGLFISSLPQTVSSAFDALEGSSGPPPNWQPWSVEDGLFFVPAVPVAHPPEYSRIAEQVRDPDFACRLRAYIDLLGRQFSCEIVILDCHGGLDYVSVAAFDASSFTIMVTEADAVTFNGTLELLSFYESARPPASPGVADTASADLENPAGHASSPSPSGSPGGRLEFVVNRLPPKYRFADVNGTYQRLLGNYRGRLKLGQEVLSFIPEESFIAESFGEYPFSVKLAPTSIIARKLQLIALEIAKPREEVLRRYAPLRRLKAPRFRRKIKETVLSAESRNTQNIIFAFGWLVTASTFTLVGIAAFALLGSLAKQFGETYFIPIVVLVFLLAAALVVYFAKAQYGITLYYRDLYRFRRALLRAKGQPLTTWQRLALLRLWLLRAGTALASALVVLAVLASLIAGLHL